MDATATETNRVLSLSPKALKRVLEIKAAEPDGNTLALWVEVVGEAHGDFAYDLYFDQPSEAGEDDVVIEGDQLTVVIPVDSVDRLTGATLDMSRDLLNPGLVVVNPNKPQAPFMAGLPDLDPSLPVDERVAMVLDLHVRPGIASHGGTAELVAIEGDAAILRLGGGCAGCGMAAVTLKQGIEVAITQAVPEITRVIDVTDHAAGTNPYYAPDDGQDHSGHDHSGHDHHH